MSADLFAEFNALSSGPPSTQHGTSTPGPSQSQQPSQVGSGPFQNQAQSQGSGNNFGWLSTGDTSSTQAWLASPPQPVAGTGSWGAPSSSSHFSPPTAGQGEFDDDGWGDFEVAEPSAKATTKTSPFPAVVDNWPRSNPQATAPSRTRPTRASTLELMSNKLVDLESTSQTTAVAPPTRVQPKARMVKKPVRNDPNVLFDVAEFELGEDDLKPGDDEDFDDFGDFETSVHATSQAKSSVVSTTSYQPSMDLLSLEEPAAQQPQKRQTPSTLKQRPNLAVGGALSFGTFSSTNYPSAPKSPSYHDRNPFPELAIKTVVEPKSKPSGGSHSATPVTAWPSVYGEKDAKGVKGGKSEVNKVQEDDEWAAWDEFPKGKEDIDATKPPESWDWDAVDNVQPADSSHTMDKGASIKGASDSDPPPINVPPPSILLSAFPDILNSGGAFLKPMSKQNASIKQQVLSDPKSVAFLRGYLLLATTAGRVIAGRKHRWHRDKILAKSMSISAAGSKGMKLAGVDKTQSVREDREAADVVVVWRENVGRVRSAVAAVNGAERSDLKVPELNDNMPISTAKMVPTSAKPCVICGLKREERIAKVDYDVEDSFGEWWVEHWGHRACKNFWIEHEQKLRQR